MTVWLGFFRPSAVTRNANSPSASEAAVSAMDNSASSFSMVPTATPSARVTLIGFWSVTLNFSSGSRTSSGCTVTSTVFSVSPGMKVRVPSLCS